MRSSPFAQVPTHAFSGGVGSKLTGRMSLDRTQPGPAPSCCDRYPQVQSPSTRYTRTGSPGARVVARQLLADEQPKYPFVDRVVATSANVAFVPKPSKLQ